MAKQEKPNKALKAAMKGSKDAYDNGVIYLPGATPDDYCCGESDCFCAARKGQETPVQEQVAYKTAVADRDQEAKEEASLETLSSLSDLLAMPLQQAVYVIVDTTLDLLEEIESERPKTVLEEAANLNDAAEEVYGDAGDNLTRIGQMWGGLLGLDPLEPALVAHMLAALSMYRDTIAPSRAYVVSAAGYLGLLEQVS